MARRLIRDMYQRKCFSDTSVPGNLPCFLPGCFCDRRKPPLEVGKDVIAGYKKEKVDVLCEVFATDARLILNMILSMENIPGYEKFFIVSRVPDKEKDKLETTVYCNDSEENSGQEKILILHTTK